MEGLLVIEDDQVSISLPSLGKEAITRFATAGEVLNFCAGLESIYGSIEWAIDPDKSAKEFQIAQKFAQSQE